MIKFTVPGEVKGKQRPKFARMGKFVSTYTPEQTVNYEAWIRQCFISKYPKWIPTEKPLIMHIRAFFIRPKSNKKPQPITVRLDADNIGKVICDGLNGIAYRDDKQIVGLTINKIWGDIARVEIQIEEMEA